MIPFGEFAPDRSKFGLGPTLTAVNALPAVDGWNPMQALVTFTDPLPDVPKGAVYARTAGGAFKIFAGTTTALYELNTADYSWTDRTGPSGPYALPVGDLWQFRPFGTRMLAVQSGNVPQYIDVNSGTAFADLGNAPAAKYVGNAGDFVVLGNLSTNPLGLRTSAIGDSDSWDVGVNLAADQTLPDGEDIQGILSGEVGALVFQRKMMRQMAISGSIEYPFTIDVVNPSRGVIAPNSICGIGPDLFGYLSTDGFCVGVGGRPIGATKVDKWFFDNVDLALLPDVKGGVDPYNKILWWQAQRTNTTRFRIGYNWQLDRWCYSDLDVYSLTDLVTPAVSWAGIDTFFDDWSEATIPWGSRILTGGQPTLAAFDDQYRLGFFTGLPLAARFDTGQIQLTTGKRSFLRELRATTDAVDHTLTVSTADRHGGALTAGSAVSPFPSTGICHFRAPGLLHKVRMDIAAGEAWTITSGVEPLFNAEGRR